MRVLALRLTLAALLAMPACSSNGREAFGADGTDAGTSFGSSGGPGGAGASCSTDADCPKDSKCAPLQQGELGSKSCVAAPVAADAGAADAAVVDAEAGAPVTYGYTPWTSSGACSAACGGGTLARTRECHRNDGAKVACALCGDDCTGTQACNTNPCGTCPSTTFAVPTDSQGTCTAVLPMSAANTTNVSSYLGGPGLTGPTCTAGNVQGSHTGTLTGVQFGTCHYYCDVIATCDASGTWINLHYTW